MKHTQAVSAGVALILAITFVSHAQETGEPLQSKQFVSADDLSTMLEAVEAATPLPVESVPQWRTFYSAQSGSRFQAMGLESSDTSDSPTYSFPTNGLWLELTGVSNELAYLNLHNATDEVYEVWSKIDLLAPSWNIEREIWPGTNQAVVPFTIPMLDRGSLFVWARDWTSVDENSNGVPDWLEYEHPGGLPPVITAQPAGQTVVQGNDVTISVIVSTNSMIPLGYQWHLNETNVLDGATNSSLVLTNVQPANEGLYRVVVTNVAGSATSSNALLTVLVPPVITEQPQSQTVIQGTKTTFSVTTTGTAPLCYQWYFNGTNSLAGATNASLAFNEVQIANAGNYSVVVTNLGGSVTSEVATLSLTCDAAPAGMVGWWPGSGDANDYAGTNNGTLQGGATFTNGMVGQAFSFDGGGGYVDVGDPSDLDMSNTFSFEAWIYPTGPGSAGAYGGILINNENEYEVARASDGSIIWAFANFPDWVNSGAITPLNQWSHVAVAYSNGIVNTYLNGVLVNTYNGVGPIVKGWWGGPDDFRIGGRSALSQFFQGLIDEVSIYNCALSSNEIAAIYAAGSAGKCLSSWPVPATPSNLVALAISPTQIGLSWNEPPHQALLQFSIERKTGSNGTYAVLAQVANVSAYIDTNLTAGTMYYYRVRAINGFGAWSDYSNETNTTTQTVGTDWPVTSLKLWLMADAGLNQIDPNSPVNFWADQSGNGNNATQGNVNARPVYVAGVVNGHSAVRFDGASSYLNLPYYLMNDATEGEMLMVLKSSQRPGSESGFCWFGNSGYNTHYTWSDGQIYDDFGSNTRKSVGTPPQPVGQYNIYGVVTKAGEWTARLNGSIIYTTGDNNVSFRTSPILGYSGYYFTGDIAEALIFNRALTPDERGAINVYLKDKYGLAPTITITSPTNNALLTSGSINLRATASEGGGGNIQQVEFFQGATSLGKSFNSPYGVTWSNAPVGTYALTAQATGVNGLVSTSAVVNITIDLPASVSIIQPTNNLVLAAPADVAIEATYYDRAGIRQVEFFQGTTSLGIVGSAPYSLLWSNVTPGIHALTARATDNDGLILTSSVVNVIVDTDPYATDSDGDGVSDMQEYLDGTDPLDYFNGHLPTIRIVGGNDQQELTNAWLASPLIVQLTDANTNVLANAPVTFMVTQGNGLIANASNGTTSSSIQLRTDANGQAAVWMQLPSVMSASFVTAGAQSGTNTTQTRFFEVARMPGEISMVAVGGEHIMELTGNGDVISWGGNQFGEFGDYTHLDSSHPVHVVGLTNIIKIVSSINYSLAIDSNGVLWAWGQLDYENQTNLPTQVLGMSNTIAIAAFGQADRNVTFLGMTNMIATAALGQPGSSADPAVAVEADGTVWMWGDNYGSYPVQIAGISNAVSVAARNYQTFALMNDGTVWMWGPGNEDPAPISGLSNIVAICAGSDHTLALAADGTIWAWGINYRGQLGDGGAEDQSDVPVAVVGLSNVVAIAAGYSHSLALDSEGRLWAWGNDGSRQLGDGGPGNNGGQYTVNLPVQVSGITNIISIAAGSDASVALDGNGNLWQWGASDSDVNNWMWGDETGLPALAPQYDDFYNGQLPNLTVSSGNNQTPHAGLEFAQPLVFRITDTHGAGLNDAPVSVEVIAGDMELRTVSGGDNYKGLRLTTDTNGEVSLIGYADRYLTSTNCLVRVLTASREQIIEVDFNETLVPLPTVSITSPVDGSTIVVGTNQNLTITANAQPGPGASIQEVDFYYQVNNDINMFLGASTQGQQGQFSFAWTNAAWWTNAIVSIFAVAVDDAGATSDPQGVTITVALDTDGNGLPDYWQLRYFGNLGVYPDADADGDGISNLQEFQDGTDPTDYYNGNLPNLTIVSGNNQSGSANSFLPLPLTVQVTDANSVVLSNAPVVLTVTLGGAQIATNDEPANLGTNLVARTDSNGMASVWVYFPPGTNLLDTIISIQVSSGWSFAETNANEVIPGRLGYWRFNTPDWVGEEGQQPLISSDLTFVHDWSGFAVKVDSISADLAYRDVEDSGKANINVWTGSIRFWFKPDWDSGMGPNEGRLIELGSQDSADGWWALLLSDNGTTLSFVTQANEIGTTNLSATINWTSDQWHQIVLTYGPSNSMLYIDGQPAVTNGTGVTCYPNAAGRSLGFHIGRDQYYGNNQARGQFDELETFNYQLPLSSSLTVALTTPLNNTITATGSTNVVTAAVTDTGDTVSRVDFFDGYRLIGTATSDPYSVDWVPSVMMLGAHYLTALAIDDQGKGRFSPPVQVFVFLDSDGDGIPDFLEIQTGTDPTVPNNPWSPPPPDPNDHTPPIIFLDEPANATQL